MKVGDQHIDHLERKARRDEDVRVATGEATLRPALECAHAGRPHRHHAATACAAVGDGLHGLGRDVVPLAVHAVLGQVFGLHRLERSRAHMQRDAGACHALGL